MPALSVRRGLAALGLAVALVPAGAATSAAAKDRCATGAAGVRHEDRVVRVRAERRDRHTATIVACVRSTGRRVRLAVESTHPDEHVSVSVRGVLAGRYAWTEGYATYAESPDVRIHRLTDLVTGAGVEVTVGDEQAASAVVAVSGGLAAVERGAVRLHRPGRAPETVAPAGAGAVDALAFAGETLYWTAGDEARSARVAALGGPVLSAVAPRSARRRARCVARGSAIVLQTGDTVLTRTRGGRLGACRRSTGRAKAVPVVADAIGAATADVVAEGLLVRTPTAAGAALQLLDVTGRRTLGSTVVRPEMGDPAFGSSEDGGLRLYWTEPDGPRSTAVAAR